MSRAALEANKRGEDLALLPARAQAKFHCAHYSLVFAGWKWCNTAHKCMQSWEEECPGTEWTAPVKSEIVKLQEQLKQMRIIQMRKKVGELRHKLNTLKEKIGLKVPKRLTGPGSAEGDKPSVPVNEAVGFGRFGKLKGHLLTLRVQVGKLSKELGVEGAVGASGDKFHPGAKKDELGRDSEIMREMSTLVNAISTEKDINRIEKLNARVEWLKKKFKRMTLAAHCERCAKGHCKPGHGDWKNPPGECGCSSMANPRCPCPPADACPAEPKPKYTNGVDETSDPIGCCYEASKGPSDTVETLGKFREIVKSSCARKESKTEGGRTMPATRFAYLTCDDVQESKDPIGCCYRVYWDETEAGKDAARQAGMALQFRGYEEQRRSKCTEAENMGGGTRFAITTCMDFRAGILGLPYRPTPRPSGDATRVPLGQVPGGAIQGTPGQEFPSFRSLSQTAAAGRAGAGAAAAVGAAATPDGKDDASDIIWKPAEGGGCPCKKKCKACNCPCPRAKANCGDPGTPALGFREGMFYTEDSLVNYYCVRGYTLTGSARRICQSNGRWSGEAVSCKPPVCPDPGPLLNGKVTGTKFSYLHKLHYKCDPPDFTPTWGNVTITCMINGKWDGRKPICVPLQEPSPMLMGSMNAVRSAISAGSAAADEESIEQRSPDGGDAAAEAAASKEQDGSGSGGGNGSGSGNGSGNGSGKKAGKAANAPAPAGGASGSGSGGGKFVSGIVALGGYSPLTFNAPEKSAFQSSLASFLGIPATNVRAATATDAPLAEYDPPVSKTGALRRRLLGAATKRAFPEFSNVQVEYSVETTSMVQAKALAASMTTMDEAAPNKELFDLLKTNGLDRLKNVVKVGPPKISDRAPKKQGADAEEAELDVLTKRIAEDNGDGNVPAPPVLRGITAGSTQELERKQQLAKFDLQTTKSQAQQGGKEGKAAPAGPAPGSFQALQKRIKEDEWELKKVRADRDEISALMMRGAANSKPRPSDEMRAEGENMPFVSADSRSQGWSAKARPDLPAGPPETPGASVRDEHGCLGSAGWVWCPTAQKCLNRKQGTKCPATSTGTPAVSQEAGVGADGKPIPAGVNGSPNAVLRGSRSYRRQAAARAGSGGRRQGRRCRGRRRAPHPDPYRAVRPGGRRARRARRARWHARDGHAQDDDHCWGDDRDVRELHAQGLYGDDADLAEGGHRHPRPQRAQERGARRDRGRGAATSAGGPWRGRQRQVCGEGEGVAGGVRGIQGVRKARRGGRGPGVPGPAQGQERGVFRHHGDHGGGAHHDRVAGAGGQRGAGADECGRGVRDGRGEAGVGRRRGGGGGAGGGRNRGRGGGAASGGGDRGRRLVRAQGRR